MTAGAVAPAAGADLRGLCLVGPTNPTRTAHTTVGNTTEVSA